MDQSGDRSDNKKTKLGIWFESHPRAQKFYSFSLYVGVLFFVGLGIYKVIQDPPSLTFLLHPKTPQDETNQIITWIVIGILALVVLLYVLIFGLMGLVWLNESNILLPIVFIGFSYGIYKETGYKWLAISTLFIFFLLYFTMLSVLNLEKRVNKLERRSNLKYTEDD